MIDVWLELDNVIDEIRNISDLMGFALVRRDGIIVAHGLTNGADPRVVAAMTAAMSGTAEMATEQLRQGRFLRTIIECEQGKILLTDAGKQALLMSLVFSDANLGLVLMELEKVGKRISGILDDTGKTDGEIRGNREVMCIDRTV